MRDARLLRREPDGTLVTHAELGEHVGGYPNDMVVDAQGRAYVGNFGFDLMGGAPVATAALLRVDPDGGVTAVAQDMWFTNGSVITDDGRADRRRDVRQPGERVRHRGRRVARATAAPGRSSPSSPPRATCTRRWASSSSAPDGCCLDAEGALWIADAVGARLLRVREGGEVVDEIGVGTGVYACMLGGGDGRTLYACAAPDFDEKARSAAREGSLIAVRVDVPHAGRP